jgi:hypothetical protein
MTEGKISTQAGCSVRVQRFSESWRTRLWIELSYFSGLGDDRTVRTRVFVTCVHDTASRHESTKYFFLNLKLGPSWKCSFFVTRSGTGQTDRIVAMVAMSFLELPSRVTVFCFLSYFRTSVSIPDDGYFLIKKVKVHARSHKYFL